MTTPCRIAILCDAGIRFVYPQVPDLAELLARDGHLVDVLGPVDAEAAAWNDGRGFRYRGLLQRGRHGWLFNLGFIAAAAWHCRKADKVIACTSVTLVPALLAGLFGKGFAFYALECQIPGEPTSGFYARFQHLLRWCQPVVATTGMHRARLLQRFLRLPRRPAVVENAALMQRDDRSKAHDVRTEVARRLGRDPGFLVVVNGGLGRVNAVDLVLEAVGALPPGVTVAMFGPVEASIRREIDAAARRGGNLVYLGMIAGGRADLIAFLASADLGLVLKRRGRGHCLNDRFYTPNKLYDFIAASVPVICSGHASLAHVARDGLGLALPGPSALALVECIRAVQQMPAAFRSEWRRHIDARYRARYHFEHDAAVFRSFCAAP